MKFDHVGVVVGDTESSVGFYQQILGATVAGSHVDERVRLTFLEVGGQCIELIQYLNRVEPPRGRGQVDHIAFQVEDMEAALLQLREFGVELLLPEPLQVGGKRIMFFAGPSGERLEFVELLPQ